MKSRSEYQAHLRRWADQEPDENLAARVDEAQHILRTSDETKVIAYLLDVPEEKVAQITGKSHRANSETDNVPRSFNPTASERKGS